MNYHRSQVRFKIKKISCVIILFINLFCTTPSFGNFWDNKTDIDPKVLMFIRKSVLLIEQRKQKVPLIEFELFSLNYEKLEELYNYLYFVEKPEDISRKLAFEVRDFMFRLALENPAAMEHFWNSPDDQFQKINVSPTHFHKLKFTNEQKLKNAQIIPKDRLIESKHLHKKIRVLHAAFEAPNAFVGGLGEFLNGLTNGENKHLNEQGQSDLEGIMITPFYDFLKKSHLHDVSFIGAVDHEVDGQVYRSTIYELQKNNTRQFLVQADPHYQSQGPNGWMRGWEFFDVVEPSKIYSAITPNNEPYSPQTMYGAAYFCASVAAVAALYCGVDGDENIDVLQLNCSHFYATSAIMQLELNPKRAQAFLPKVGIVATIHDTNFFNVNISSSELARVGLTLPVKDNVNKQVVFHVYSNMSNFVSEEMGKDVLDTSAENDLGLGAFFNALQSLGKFALINNGINFNSFNPRNFNVLGTLRVNNDLSNLSQKKIEAKNILCNAGIIESATKPLFLYIGRIAWDKGIDVLSEFAKYVVTKRSGQFVILGIIPGNALLTPEWIELSKDPKYQRMIKVYLDHKRDQLDFLEEISAQKGKIIRFAADFTIMPSVVEGFGLVAIETLALGGGLITSRVQGIKDICKRPLGESNNQGGFYNVFDFNCISFDRVSGNLSATLTNLIDNSEFGLEAWSKLNASQQEVVQRNWIKDAEGFEWNIKGGAVDKYKLIYLKALSQETRNEELIRNSLIKSYLQ